MSAPDGLLLRGLPAIRRIVREHAAMTGEDVVGALLKAGIGQTLSETETVALARFLEVHEVQP